MIPRSASAKWVSAKRQAVSAPNKDTTRKFPKQFTQEGFMTEMCRKHKRHGGCYSLRCSCGCHSGSREAA